MTKKIKATLASEIAHEQEYKKIAETLLRASYEQTAKDGNSNTRVARRLVEHVFNDVFTSFKENIFAIEKYSKKGVKPSYFDAVLTLMSNFENEKENDAVIKLFTACTLNEIVVSVLSVEDESISQCAHAIAKSIKKEVKAFYFMQQLKIEKGSHNANRFDDFLKKRTRGIFKDELFLSAYRKNKDNIMSNYHDVDKKSLVKLALSLIEYARLTSDFFTLEEGEKIGKGSKTRVLRASNWFRRTYEKNIDVLAKHASKYPPMLVPPKPWTSIHEGGYYDVLSRDTAFIRLDFGMSNKYMQDYKKRLARIDMSYLFNVVNALQNTPFEINERILQVATTILDNNGGIGGIDSTLPMPTLPTLPEPYTDEQLKQHRYKLSLLRKADRARQSRLLRLRIALATAKKYSQYEKLYFPWNMDYRGRIYPIPTEISPQGDDIQKSLLLFNEPCQCQHESDLNLFMIEGANRAGIDKKTFKERIEWIAIHEKEILKSAEKPLTSTDFWSKQDEPFQFLAWCFEYQALKKYMQEHNNSIVGFKCHVPINYDGTCSGLQHYSMLLHDEIGGDAVNLVPQDKVNDVYRIVADKINPILKRDSLSGTDDSINEESKDNSGIPLVKYGTKTLATWWLLYARAKLNSDGITRKVCKRSVMTLAYGSGKYGFAENLKEDIIKPYVYEHVDNPIFLNHAQASQYMANLIDNAVRETVVKAVEGMEYLKKVASLICKNGECVQWLTPNGLLVQQNKFVDKFEVVQLRIQGIRHRLYIKDEPTTIDSRGQAQAIAPNFIHSLDATHLQRVVNSMNDKGCTNFMMIHDSFGTDLAHAGDLFKTIRYEFRKMYEQTDYLNDFLNDVAYLIDEKDKKKLPEMPTHGKLNIADVETSLYCFA